MVVGSQRRGAIWWPVTSIDNVCVIKVVRGQVYWWKRELVGGIKQLLLGFMTIIMDAVTIPSQRHPPGDHLLSILFINECYSLLVFHFVEVHTNTVLLNPSILSLAGKNCGTPHVIL